VIKPHKAFKNDFFFNLDWVIIRFMTARFQLSL